MIWEKHDPAARDLVICIGALSGIYVLFSSLDLAEAWNAWSGSYEAWDAPGLFMALGLSPLCFAWYAYRRWRESRREASHRREAKRQLRQEISERRESETLLQASQDRLQQASQLAKIGYFVWDVTEDRCLYCSAELAQIHGLTPSDYVARTATPGSRIAMTHPDDRDALRQAIESARRGQAFDIEYRTVLPNGELRYLRELSKPIFDFGGAVVQEIGACQDITATKLAERRLCRLQKMEVVGQLTTGIAHEFNNLLTVIKGNAELLRDGSENDRSLLDNIERASGRGTELTQGLLAFSRRQFLRPQTLDLENLVLDMQQLLSQCLGKTIEVEVKTARDLWTVLADQGQLENALLSLAINARDAMPNGGTLTVECSNARIEEKGPRTDPDLKAGDYVVLAVSDTGRGMSVEVQARAIEPFFTTKDVGKGSGLGLSMVYGFARQSGGTLLIQSAERQGTTTRLYLPRAEQTALVARHSPDADMARGRSEAIP